MVSLSYLFENDQGEGQYKVPLIGREKEKRFNPKTNRVKTFKTIRYLLTDIKPEDRTFKNLPRYANKKPKVKFQDWLCIESQKRHPTHSVYSFGKGADGKWYGWSHRAVHGFLIGDTVKDGDIIYKGKEYTIENEDQAKQAAIDFAAEVS